ncbi:MAG: hypothetical protein ACOC1O_06495 [bacterium]
MVDDVKLAKHMLEHGSIEESIKSIINDVLSKHIGESNDAVTRQHMINEIDTALLNFEDETGLEFKFSKEENLIKGITYHVHFLGKVVSFTMELQ